MKIKHVVLLSNLFAIAVAATALVPTFAQAQSTQQIAQSQPTPSGLQIQRGRGMESLNLSDAQKVQMKQIKDDSKAAIANVLTPEQKAQWQSLKQGGQKKGVGGMKALNLSEAQKTQIKQIRDSARQRMEAILTPEQRAQFQQKRQNKMRSQGRTQNL
jgi:periplasmic protein CpxP/Spy